MCFCVSVCVWCMCISVGVHGGQRYQILLEPELQVVVSQLIK